jgi:hypothetical protein
MLASIATQDYFKVAGIILVILGTLMATMGMADPLLSLFAW